METKVEMSPKSLPCDQPLWNIVSITFVWFIPLTSFNEILKAGKGLKGCFLGGLYLNPLIDAYLIQYW